MSGVLYFFDEKDKKTNFVKVEKIKQITVKSFYDYQGNLKTVFDFDLGHGTVTKTYSVFPNISEKFKSKVLQWKDENEELAKKIMLSTDYLKKMTVYETLDLEMFLTMLFVESKYHNDFIKAANFLLYSNFIKAYEILFENEISDVFIEPFKFEKIVDETLMRQIEATMYSMFNSFISEYIKTL